jgi:hypothetical protein
MLLSYWKILEENGLTAEAGLAKQIFVEAYWFQELLPVIFT